MPESYDVYRVEKNAEYLWLGSADSLRKALRLAQKAQSRKDVFTFCVYSHDTRLRTFYSTGPNAELREMDKP